MIKQVHKNIIPMMVVIGIFLSVALAQNTKYIGEVISTEDAVKKQVGGGKAVIQIFKEGKEAFVGRLTVAANGKVPLHKDPTEEYLLIEKGNGTISINGIKSKVKAGDFIYMPALAEVSFQNGAQQLVALQIFAGPQSARKYDRWETMQQSEKKD